MKIIGKLIRLHKGLFITTMILSVMSVFFTLYWNSALANLLNSLQNAVAQQKQWMNNQILLSENTSSIEPLITEADVILLYEAEDLMIKKCEMTSRKLMKMNMRIHVRNAVSDAVIRLFGSYGYLVILLIGYSMICKDNMAFSDLVYGFQVRGSLLAGLTMLITSWNNIKMNSVCINRLNDIVEE